MGRCGWLFDVCGRLEETHGDCTSNHGKCTRLLVSTVNVEHYMTTRLSVAASIWNAGSGNIWRGEGRLPVKCIRRRQ